MSEKPIELDLFSPSDFEEGLKDAKEEVKEGSDDVVKEEVGEEKNIKDSQEKDGNASPANPYVSSDSIASLFLRLSHSKFRSSFYLNQKDKDIIASKGIATIREHARQIIAKRLAPAVIPNDGKQTPMRHGTSPVFIAQHATGCCCRGCLEKWHHIPKGRALTGEEQEYVVEVLMHWIESHA